MNRVSQSGIITLDLEDYYHKGERVFYDIKDNLFQEMILKEKDFREFLKAHDWERYKGCNVAVTCSVDAIVPTWAYMLMATKLRPFVNKVVFGDFSHLEQELYKDALAKVDPEDYRDKKVVVKGCGKLPVPVYAYVEITNILFPVVQSLMFGEPCSTVPLYKRSKA